MKLLSWIQDKDWDSWDKQLEADIASGKLNFLAKEALEEKKLPAPIQKTARINYELIKDNPKHPSLHFKKLVFFGLQELAFITVLCKI